MPVYLWTTLATVGIQALDQALKCLRFVRMILTHNVGHTGFRPGVERRREMFRRARHPILTEEAWHVAEIAPSDFQHHGTIDMARPAFNARRLEFHALRRKFLRTRNVLREVPNVGVRGSETQHARSRAAG